MRAFGRHEVDFNRKGCTLSVGRVAGERLMPKHDLSLGFLIVQRMNGGVIHWGHVGDLGRADQALDELLATFDGQASSAFWPGSSKSPPLMVPLKLVIVVS